MFRRRQGTSLLSLATLATLTAILILGLLPSAAEAQGGPRGWGRLNPTKYLPAARKFALSECSVQVGDSFLVDGVPTVLSFQVFTGTPERPGLLTQFDRSDLRTLGNEAGAGRILIHNGAAGLREFELGGLRGLTVANYSADGWESEANVKEAAKCGLRKRLRGGLQHEAFFALHSDVIAGALLADSPDVAGAYFKDRAMAARGVRDLARRVEATLSEVLGEANLPTLAVQSFQARQAQQAQQSAPPPKPANCYPSTLKAEAQELFDLAVKLKGSDHKLEDHEALVGRAGTVLAQATACAG